MMRPARGYGALLFVCPFCGTVDKWGTAGIRGHCRGELDGLLCTFEWRRVDDWRVFKRARDGSPFVSRAEYERSIGPIANLFRGPAVLN